jgi:hypothetical protein
MAQNQSTEMSIDYQWDGDNLMIGWGGYNIPFSMYQLETWNEIAKDRQYKSLGEHAEAYGAEMSRAKHQAIKYGKNGVRIIKEITRLATQNLELVMKLTKKSAKCEGVHPSRPVAVNINPKTMKVVCSTCGCSPTDKKLLLCARCHSAYYCDITCQRGDWAEHKTKCCK